MNSNGKNEQGETKREWLTRIGHEARQVSWKNYQDGLMVTALCFTWFVMRDLMEAARRRASIQPVRGSRIVERPC